MSVQRRVVIATVVAVLGAVFGVPGTGHAYLREWRRALGWFAGIFVCFFVLTVAFANPEAFSDPMAVGFDTLPEEVTLPTIGLLALNTVDAYYVARRQETAASQSQPSGRGNGSATDESSCPHCGKPVDRDLDFCHWCTEPIDGTPDE